VKMAIGPSLMAYPIQVNLPFITIFFKKLK